MKRAYFSSKILLFGEYTVIEGGSALAMPFSKYQGRFRKEQSHDSKNISLEPFSTYLAKNNDIADRLNIVLLRKDIEAGMFFYSDIPVGYGAGSSGALVAATFAGYGEFNRYDLDGLKHILGRMESFFHGSSSGMDPLVSYLNQPIRTLGDGRIELVDKTLNPILSDFYILDSQISRETAPLVEMYKGKLSEIAFKKRINYLSNLVSDCIINLTTNQNKELLDTQMREISELQWNELKFLIPKHIAEIWRKGLDGNGPLVKLCGAGGGGFFLLYDILGSGLETSDTILDISLS